MARNILLLFLSDVKTKKVGDEFVISEAHYKNIDGENTRTTNESAVRYLLQRKFNGDPSALDTIFIAASKKVRGNIPKYLGKDGKEQTHLDFTKERFKKFLPNTCVEVFDYDEDGSNADNLKSIAKMARRIQNFAADKEVTLHVDLTGGMRHVNMMILELTRLLEYSGLSVGNVLYSNYDFKSGTGRIEEVQNIYELFQLMAGVEEFVNFGSVKALKSYYAGKNLSEPLKKLLLSMENFAKAIKLCHYEQFQETVQNLHDAVHDFDKQESENVEDVLMARLIGRIRQNYHDLIAVRDKDDLRVIRWCLDNDYLQQALTLYTERIPEYLGEKKIVTQSPEEAARLKNLVDNDSMGRNSVFYLFSEFKPKEDRLGETVSLYRRSLKVEMWASVRKKSFDFVSWAENLDKKIAPFSVVNEARLRLQLETFAEIFRNHTLLADLRSPKLEPIRKLIEKLSPELEQQEKGFVRKNIIAKFMDNAKAEVLMKIFDGVSFVQFTTKYPNAQKVYELLTEKVFSVTVDEEKFLSIMNKYFVIKRERNRCNHANEESEFRSVEDLREFMNEAIEEIKSILEA